MEDIVAIIDELEDLLLSKKRGFFSGKIYVDQDRVSEIISHLRDAVPQSFREASSILKQRDELLAQCKNKPGTDGGDPSQCERDEREARE